MTLTEFKYLVAIARERHFGRAAEACFVSQPTLSVAVKKLEDELGVKIFERSSNEVAITPVGERLVNQAQNILEQAELMREIASSNNDPLKGSLRLGVIYTVGPYLLPQLVQELLQKTPQMPLILQENFTSRLLEMLRLGEIDCAILAEPFPETNLAIASLYMEPFLAAVPGNSPLVQRDSISVAELKNENMLLLGNGHCFRDHVLQVCPEFAGASSTGGNLQKSFEGSSLETIKHMIASGVGVTLVPRTAVPKGALGVKGEKCPRQPVGQIHYLKIEEDGVHSPMRKVVLVWRRSFTRYEAIAALRNAIFACDLEGVEKIY